jgi:CRP/FNR family cyclic AMP-dependent transcriptional regulator
MKTLETTIAEHPFFHDLAPSFYPLLAACARRVKFRAHEQIFRKDFDAGSFYLVLSGEIAVETPYIPGEGVIKLLTLGAGEALGWSWLFPPYQWHFSARAEEDTDAIVFDADELRALAADKTALGYFLAIRVGGMLLQRLQSTRVRLLDLCEVSA